MLQVCFIQKMPGQFSSGAGKIRPFICMLGHDAAYPHLWPKGKHQKE